MVKEFSRKAASQGIFLCGKVNCDGRVRQQQIRGQALLYVQGEPKNTTTILFLQYVCQTKLF